MTLETDIAIIGGSMGGVAASLAACDAGLTVILTEATDWLGGQMTSQGVSAFDEHRYIEQFGATKRYAALRQRIRTYYRERYGVAATMPDGKPLNPGNGWVSRLCFEPTVGVRIVEAMLEPHLQSGKLTILYNSYPVAAKVTDDRVLSVTVRSPEANVTIKAPYFLDATDLGELLPLTHTAYVTGAESRADTGEPLAPADARPNEVQSFTYPFAVEWRPGENHRIDKPEGYDPFLERQPYSLSLSKHIGSLAHYRVFARGEADEHPFWTYRRIFDASLFADPANPNDISMMNWAGNDYRFSNIIDKSPAEIAAALDEAKRLSLGFLYWLQTDCPRDEGGYGYPEMKLREDVMGTADGLSKAPYIRESRRIVGLERITQADIDKHGRRARAKPCPNSVGVGWYQMDLHPSVGNDEATLFAPTLPFQLPLGALIPVKTKNLLAACKNIATTHLTNGAYRLHPVEWAVGEAAATLAVYCLKKGVAPAAAWSSSSHTQRVQDNLLVQGVPLAWGVDVPVGDRDFLQAQRLLLEGRFDTGIQAERLELNLSQTMLAGDDSSDPST